MAKKIGLVFFLFASVIYCQRWSNKYLFNEVDGFVKLSKETMNVLVDKMNYPIKDKHIDDYEYIFQKFPLDTLLVCPYIRIQINEYGRLRKSELENFTNSYYKYDSENGYLLKEKEDQLNAIIPTNLGTINIYCYSTKENYSKDKESFKKFINSIMLFPDVKYKASFVRDIPFINDVFYEGKHLIAIIMFISIVVIFLMRKKSKRVVT